MSDNKIYVGDNPLVKLDCVSDITGASGTLIKYRKPSGIENEWAATITNDTETGLGRYLTYQTIVTDLDESGDWRFQAFLTVSGWIGRGETAIKRIYSKFT